MDLTQTLSSVLGSIGKATLAAANATRLAPTTPSNARVDTFLNMFFAQLRKCDVATALFIPATVAVIFLAIIVGVAVVGGIEVTEERLIGTYHIMHHGLPSTRRTKKKKKKKTKQNSTQTTRDAAARVISEERMSSFIAPLTSVNGFKTIYLADDVEQQRALNATPTPAILDPHRYEHRARDEETHVLCTQDIRGVTWLDDQITKTDSHAANGGCSGAAVAVVAVDAVPLTLNQYCPAHVDTFDDLVWPYRIEREEVLPSSAAGRAQVLADSGCCTTTPSSSQTAAAATTPETCISRLLDIFSLILLLFCCAMIAVCVAELVYGPDVAHDAISDFMSGATNSSDHPRIDVGEDMRQNARDIRAVATKLTEYQDSAEWQAWKLDVAKAEKAYPSMRNEWPMPPYSAEWQAWKRDVAKHMQAYPSMAAANPDVLGSFGAEEDAPGSSYVGVPTFPK